MKTIDFIEKAIKIHGNKFDYSKVEYVNSKTKVCIICPKHGEFWQLPNNHLQGKGCLKCKYDKLKKKQNISINDFITKAKEIHGGKYDYSKVEYVNNSTKVCIICPEHGEFYQTPKHHINRGQGCPKCQGLYVTNEEFIKKAKEIHGDKYDYSLTEYNGSHKKVKILCLIHGEFEIIAKDHLNGQGCGKCRTTKIWNSRGRISNDEFIQKYYNKFPQNKNQILLHTINYINYRTKISACCNEHGIFEITPNNLMLGRGCPLCSKHHHYNTNEIIQKFKNIHNNKYDYSKVDYVNNKTKVCIICPEHGEFYQTPSAHLNSQGCPKCKMSHIENNISMLLTNNFIKYDYESNINGLLKRQSVDFYLPEYNIAIECQGGQHFYNAFNRNNIEKANKIHQNVLKRDIIKNKILLKNNIKIFYYTNISNLPIDIFYNTKYNNIYNQSNFFTDLNELLIKVKEHL